MSGPTTWHWRKLAPCDLDQMTDGLNPQMKELENALDGRRPACMSGYPAHVGAINESTIVSHTGDTDETELKSVDFGYGAISEKGGFRVTAAGTASGAGGAKTITLNWGGIEIGTISLTTGTLQWWLEATFWNTGTTQTQRWFLRTWTGATVGGTAVEILEMGTDDVDTG